ncbi:hypothetical protein CTAYLR_002438 [Chrysophaeum taylorii]|uniref:GOLD domain-containing protein n=1 Tax=Chrysophaeum taylorii TaxID=2483200 RepID=A0AAD7UM35_9STRA|nr:hypothetical protein CTAYLR_002438 [Chrysophaeum taylorii]
MVRERWRLVFLALSAQAVTVKLRPKESRCVWTHVAAKGEKATVEVFVESGGALNARLEIVGPYAMDEEGTPFVDAEDVPTVHDATFSSAETVDGVFASPTIVEFDAEAPGAYKACVFNSVSRFEHKVVDIDFRTSER